MGIVFALPASSTIYAYTDAQGRIRITDIPQKEGQEIVLQSEGVTTRSPAVSATRNSYPQTIQSGNAASKEWYRNHVEDAAREFGISEALIYAVIKVESNFNAYAVSRAGALGLMQLMPGTARMVGVKNAFDPRQNIMGGAKYLRMMIDRFGRVDHALAAYNAGPETVQRYRGIPPIAETRKYVPSVLKFYQKYGGQTGRALLAKSTVPEKRQTAAVVAKAAVADESVDRANVVGSPLFYYRGPDGQIYITNFGR